MKLAKLTSLQLASAAIALFAALASSNSAYGQAQETGSIPVTATVYAGGTLVTPDDGPPKDKGFIAGAALTRNFRLLQPALDARYGYATGQNIDESYFIGNVKIAKALGYSHRIRPYGLIGIGYGKVKYPGGFQDNSIVYGAGAGLDYTVTTHFSAKADWEYQFWNVGAETHGLTPSVISVGVSYRVRLRR